jgi:subtilisin family serine protease
MALFSNYGIPIVQIAAPGVSIISTMPGDKWQSQSGTSMATPLIAGLIARLLSGGMSPDEAILRLQNTSTRTEKWKNKVAWGGVVDPSRLFDGID